MNKNKGNGKSSLIKALVSETEDKFTIFNVNGNDLINKNVSFESLFSFACQTLS